VLSTLVSGCAAERTRFDVTDYRPSGGPQEYHQSFDECYYRLDAARNLELVARHTTPGDGGLENIQVVHLRTFWRAVPGRTPAERTMINATVAYMIVTWPTGADFRGSGFVSFTENREGTEVTGRLERSSLKPHRRLGDAPRLFDRAELTGRFVAERNEARVIEILNDMERLFGPPPDETPPPTDPDVW
jgi:hypothetical protein